MPDLDYIRQEALRARRAARRIINEIDKPEPEPEPGDMLVGVWSTRVSYTEQVGRQWDVIRYFQSGATSLPGAVRNWLNRGTAVVFTVKSQDNPISSNQAAQYEAMLESVPDNAGRLFFGVWHEPDQSRRIDPQAWGETQAQVSAMIARVNLNRTVPIEHVMILMGWGIGEPDTNEDYLDAVDFFKDDAFLFVDCYNWPRQNIDLDEGYTASVVAELRRRGWRWGFGEVATWNEDVDWPADNANWAKANGCVAFCYFDEDKPQEDPDRTWEMSDAQIRSLASV